MKSKVLIEKLKELDPTGEIEVCDGNQDILCLQLKPSYWDGNSKVFIRDEKLKGYNIKGVKICESGSKISIISLSLEDVIWEDPSVEIDLSDLSSASHIVEYTNEVKKIRAEALEFREKYEQKEG